MRRKAHTVVEVELRSFSSALHKANCRRHAVASLPRDGGTTIRPAWTGEWFPERGGDEKNLLPLPRIKQRFLCRPARRLVTIPTELSGLT